MNALAWNERLRTIRMRLALDQEDMGRRLGVSREWISKLERGHEEPSAALQEQIIHLEQGSLHKSAAYPEHLKKGGFAGRVEEPAMSKSRVVAARFSSDRKAPLTQHDCESYFQKLMRTASEAQDPNAWPVIYYRLKREFPLDEWKREEQEKD